MSDPTAPEAQAVEDGRTEFARGWAQATGDPEPMTAHAIEDFLAVEWTAIDTARCAALARHVCAERTGYHVWLGQLGWGQTLARVAEHLACIARNMAHDGWMDLRAALAWVTWLAGAPAADAERLLPLLASDPKAGVPAPIRRWHEAVGDLAPLAWSAGLGIEEAEVRAATGTLTEPELRTLAGLRGYRLPQVEAAGPSAGVL